MRFKQIIFSSLLWRGLYFFTVLLLNIVVSRYFQAKGTGWIYYIINYFSFILIVASLSLESGMTFFASKMAIRENKLATFSVVWSTIVSVVIVLLIYLYYKNPNQEITRNQFAFFAITYISGILLTTFFCSLFYTQKNYALPNIILSITNALLIIYFLVSLPYDTTPQLETHLLRWYFLNYVIQGVLLAIAYWKRNELAAGFSLPGMAELKMLFRYSLFALSSNLVFFLLYRIDYWFVKNNCPVCHEGDLGNYIQVSKMGQMFLLLPGILASTIFPRTAAGFREQVNNALSPIIKGILLLYGGIMILLALTGHFLFPWVYGPSFINMYVPFLLLIPGVLALSVMALFSAYNAGKDKVSTNMKASLIGLFIIVAGDIYFIPRYGINAAAVISSVGYMGSLIFIIVNFKKEYKTSMVDFIIPRRSDWDTLKKLILSAERDDIKQS